MRTYAVIISLLFLLSLWWNFDTYQTADDNQKALQAEVNIQKDSADLERDLKLIYKDSFILSEQASILYREETERAHAETRKAIRYAESLKFVRFTRDEQRDSVLRVLYPH